MKIVDANVSLASKHHTSKNTAAAESLKFWINFQPRLEPGQTNPTQIRRTAIDWNDLIAKIEALLEQYRIETITTEPRISEIDQLKLDIIERFIYALTGKKVKFKMLQRPDFTAPDNQRDNNGQAPALPLRPVFRFEYTRRELTQETEKLLFTANGKIKTADNREIDFDTQLFMSRELASLSNISTEAGKLIDPLVINFNGPAAGITETKFSFDLDVNGEAEQIPFVSEGSGLLALDLNRDNQINDGSELFGAVTGNGFAELAEYDQDSNGWIDESDQIYDRLRIWTKDSEGRDSLIALGRKGVGALYLGNINAQFTVKNLENQMLGLYRKAGIFVREDGTVGTMQQVDFVV